MGGFRVQILDFSDFKETEEITPARRSYTEPLEGMRRNYIFSKCLKIVYFNFAEEASVPII